MHEKVPHRSYLLTYLEHEKVAQIFKPSKKHIGPATCCKSNQKICLSVQISDLALSWGMLDACVKIQTL